MDMLSVFKVYRFMWECGGAAAGEVESAPSS